MGHTGKTLQQVARNAMTGKGQDPANLGRRVLMANTSVVGGYKLLLTSLITRRLDKPAELLVTLMTPTRGPSGTSPWFQTFNGTATPPDSGNFSAPQLPDVGRGLRVKMRWGAGGAAMETEFDYPAMGATFGLTCDTVDIDVYAPDLADPFVYASLDLVPFVGAWMCPGRAADPTSLRWLETTRLYPPSTPIWYAVKPFSRRVSIRAVGLALADAGLNANFLDTAGGLLATVNIPVREDYQGATFGSIDAVIDIPSQATIMNLLNDDSGAEVQGTVEWQIGFV